MDGAKLLDANWDLAIKQRRGQLNVRLPHGTTMDLHWHLLNAGRVRATFSLSMPSIWQRTRTVAIRDLQVDTLSVTDTRAHLGLHAALRGAWRLRWPNDLKLVIAHEPIEWASVLKRARQWRASRLLGVALLRSARLLGADVPDDMLTELLGSHVHRHIAEALDRIWSPSPPHVRRRRRNCGRSSCATGVPTCCARSRGGCGDEPETGSTVFHTAGSDRR